LHPGEENETVAAEAVVEPAATNCALTEETLSQTCVDSLDTEQCEDHPVRSFE